MTPTTLARLKEELKEKNCTLINTLRSMSYKEFEEILDSVAHAVREEAEQKGRDMACDSIEMSTTKRYDEDWEPWWEVRRSTLQAARLPHE